MQGEEVPREDVNLYMVYIYIYHHSPSATGKGALCRGGQCLGGCLRAPAAAPGGGESLGGRGMLGMWILWLGKPEKTWEK